MMTTSNEIVPLSTSVAYPRPQYNIVDERQIQPYQQPKNQPWTSDNSEIPLVENRHEK